MSAAAQVWLPAREAAELLGHSSDRPLRRDLRIHPDKFVHEMRPGPTGAQYHILLSSLPPEIQAKYWKARAELDGTPVVEEDALETEMDLYHRAPGWARKQADKYVAVIRATEGLKGRSLKEYLDAWNLENPEMATSYSRLKSAIKIYQEKGLPGLLSKNGKSAGNTTVQEEWYEFFKSVFLKEGGPSIQHAWLLTLGFARQTDRTWTRETFPSCSAFERLLKRRVPFDAIYLARQGESRWYRKFASFASRDYSEIHPGEVWVSDHAQIDVMVTMPNGKPCFPWVTVWRCFKSGKWLGWCLHAEAPNSDHIFEAFYNAALEHGLPSDIIIDNGKDYRSRSFTGGRANHKLKVDESQVRSLVGGLRITPHFALPYNAQTKPIERDFLKFKGWLSKVLVGYRGGNVVERPEMLEHEIKAGKIIAYADFEAIFERFVSEIFNNMPSQGKILKGQSPNEYWNLYFSKAGLLRRVTADALRLFCSKTSSDVTIGRNGVRDSELGLIYFAEWMTTQKGRRVYLRRAKKAFQDAWVFSSETDEYLGLAILTQSYNAISRTDIDKDKVKALMAMKKQELKLKKALIKSSQETSPDELLTLMASGLAGITRALPAPAPLESAARFEITELDRAIAQEKRMGGVGGVDISKAVPPTPPKPKKLFQFRADQSEAEAKARQTAV